MLFVAVAVVGWPTKSQKLSTSGSDMGGDTLKRATEETKGIQCVELGPRVANGFVFWPSVG